MEEMASQRDLMDGRALGGLIESIPEETIVVPHVRYTLFFAKGARILTHFIL